MRLKKASLSGALRGLGSSSAPGCAELLGEGQGSGGRARCGRRLSSLQSVGR